MLLKKKVLGLGLLGLAVLLLAGVALWPGGAEEEKIRENGSPAGVAGTAAKPATPPPSPPLDAEERNFFVEYRIEREQTRGRRVDLLREIIADPNAGAEARKAAQDQLLEITREMDEEVRLENLLRAEGFDDAAVFVGDGKVTVVVPAGITAEQNTSIVNLVARGADVLPENVLVVTHKA